MALAADGSNQVGNMQSSDIWDVFYKPDDPAGMWFGFQLARSLAEHRQRVRLFCHDVSGLSVAHADLDPRVLIQNLGSMEILDQRLARTAAAAPNLVQVFDAPAPPPYMARYFSQQSSGGWYSLHAPWHAHEAQSSIQLRGRSQMHRQFDVYLGESPNSAGLIRSSNPPQVLRKGPQALAAARASILSLLGMSSEHLENRTTLYLSAESEVAWAQWLRVLIDADVNHCLFLQHGPLQEKIAPIFSRQPGQPGSSSIGALTVIFLPPLLWALEDEIITVCDYVLTDRDDVTFRAAERGTPAVRAELAPADIVTGQWLMSGAKNGLAAIYRDTAAALSRGANVPASIAAYTARLGDFSQQARELQERGGRATELVSLLLTSSEVGANANVERLFAPTQPNPML